MENVTSGSHDAGQTCYGMSVGMLFAGREILSIDQVGIVAGDIQVSPTLYTDDSSQVVVYYGRDHGMRLAERVLPSREWATRMLGSSVGWDSHNYVSVAFDRSKRLHLAGNMHASPLSYFRSSTLALPTHLERESAMVDPELERHVTYPRFIRKSSGELVFFFRNGKSGNGDYLIYAYDEAVEAWRRISSSLLIDGEGSRSSYLDTNGPIVGPDGRYHLLWVWRDGPEAETTHTISYACSEDLINWYDSSGQAFDLPMTLENSEIVSDVPTSSGLINNNVKLGFDASGRPVVIYHRHDSNGRMQIWLAANRDGGWPTWPLTDWEFEWSFGGVGTLRFDLELETPRGIGEEIEFEFRLRSVPYIARTRSMMSSAVTARLSSSIEPTIRPGLTLMIAPDSGRHPGTYHRVLCWESVQSNRDKEVFDAPATGAPLYLLELGPI